MEPEIVYGKQLIPDGLPAHKGWLVLVAPPLRETIASLLSGAEAYLVEATSLEESHLVHIAESLPPAGAILGIGGGVAIDTAKYIAWMRNVPLYLAPSVISVDAFLTESIAVRRDGRVHYLGEVYAQQVLIDFSLIQTAPPSLNRAGAGDILSIHTALWDWRAAAVAGADSYDETIATKSRALLDTLAQAADDIRRVTETGIRTLVELYAEEVRLCRLAGSSRPEEGSEHFWTYNVEHLYPRAYVHGELVSLGVLFMAQLQQNRLEWVAGLVRRLGIRYRPEEIGLSEEAVVHSLVTAKAYVESDGLAYSVLNLRPLNKEQALEMYRIVTTLGEGGSR
ncbi:MAG: iron-containing alcohol dehydrogenase [Firmicutes bacterium]|nr:iron-containing alcohol dehydrogenase [Bacillota bacterium]